MVGNRVPAVRCDALGFEAFYRRHVAETGGYARTLVPASEVDDIVSLTFSTAWKRFDGISKESGSSWLRGVVRNHSRNRWRAGARERSLIEAITRIRPRFTTCIADSGFDSSEVEPIIDAIRDLDERDRELMILIGWFEMTPNEIAEVIGVLPGTVRVRLHRARRIMSTYYRQLADGG